MNGLTDSLQITSKQGRKSIARDWTRTLLMKLLSRLGSGQIILHEEGQKWSFGSGSPTAHVTVNDRTVYRKVLFGGSIGAGEAYVDKLYEVDDLPALIRIMVLNIPLLDRMERGFAWLKKPFDLTVHLFNTNSKRGSKRNILAHYDLGNDMYKSFLDRDMMYSAALYPHPDATLDEAQQHKLELICRKLDLQPDDSVIEIGSGWGAFAIYAASHFGCRVTTTTISDAQYEEACKKIAAAGLNSQITILRSDYRELSGQYDKLVSIEMVEAVGHSYLPVFFKKCCELLKPDGKMLLQAITIIDQKYKQYTRSVDFIQRYIFPGGCLLSNNRIVQLLALKTDMVVRHIDDFGLDYARTIQDWRKRFHMTFPELEKKGYDETFKRLWDFYLCYCLGGFLERYISVVHVVATRPGNNRISG
jgi:cyclopropane-fatty-acyl-phospholipid synthase